MKLTREESQEFKKRKLFIPKLENIYISNSWIKEKIKVVTTNFLENNNY